MKYVVVVGAVAIFLGTVVTSAQERGPMDRGGWMAGPQRIMSRLKLNDEQKSQVEKLRFDLAKQMIAQRAKIANAELEYRQLIRAETPDRTSIVKKSGELADLRTQSRTMLLDQWFAVNKLLNPEQQKVWKNALVQGSHVAMRRPAMRGMRRFGLGSRNQRDGGPGGPDERKAEE